MRRHLLAWLVTLLLAATGPGSAGCEDDDGTPGAICGNGVLEAGEQCDDGAGNSDVAADACRTTCRLAACGDGIQDSAEGCDDGNTTPLDGCSATCQPEVAGCGNGIVDAGETCDDGNTVSGDGCSATCQSEFCGDGLVQTGEQCDEGEANSDTHADACRSDCTLPRCGDGVRDSGEACDDGNAQSGDGCTPACEFEANVCGNGVVDAGEQCDDGNVTSGDGCSATCAFEAGDCGDGVLNAGEQCDDGNTLSGDGCDPDCQLEGAVCGNGIVELGEQCDDGNTLSGDGCSASCRSEAAACGNGVLEAGEQCDDGNTLSGDGCSATCRTEVVPGCGNGTVDPGEQCDDGNLTACDGCSAACRLEACGNGVVECGEGCDDGNTAAGDGCSATCTVEPVTTCQAAAAIACGETRTGATTAAGATNNLTTYSCSSWAESGPEYAMVFTAPTASNVSVTLSGLSSDLDVFVIEEEASACDVSSCIGYGNTTATFTSVAGARYYLVVDGYQGASGPFSIQVTCGACGDGNVDPGEQCDDGNTTSGDGCSAACALEGCGNGTLDAGEECDDGDTDACDGCSATCRIEACGNGVVECGEECDDGNTSANDGCSATCTNEGGTCEPAFDIACGGTDRWSTTSYGATDDISYYSCVGWLDDGPEYVYRFVAPQTGQVTARISDLDAGVDLDMFVLSDAAGSCRADHCLAYGSLSATFAAVAGQTYYLAVDGYHGAQGNFTLAVSCAGGTCGDGVVNAGEGCDDGDTTGGDGCSATCQVERCGNGVLDVGEACDDGNTVAGDGCSPSCQDESVRCVPEMYLTCGDSDTWNNGSGGSTDNLGTYPGCGTWDESGPEYAYWFYAYEDLPTVTVTLTNTTQDVDVFVLEDDGDSGCSAGSCIAYGGSGATFAAVAGSYYYIVVDGYQGDVSDYTVTLSCGTADPVCPNGSVEPGEECDDGNTTGGDGCSASCTLEAGTCSSTWTLGCGESDTWTTEYGTNRISKYGCSIFTESGPEYTYQFTAPATGPVTVTMGNVDPTVDLDLFVLLSPWGSCAAGNCVVAGDDAGMDTVTFDALEGETYYLVVDGFSGAEGTYDIAVTCP